MAEKIKKIEKIQKLISKIFFDKTWLIGVPLFKFFLKYEATGKQNLSKVNSPIIIAVNHISFIDGFLLGAAFPFNSKLYPFYFAVSPNYYFSPIFKPFLWLYSSFPVFKGIGLEKSLRYPLRLLRQGRTVAIFPEGKIRRKKDEKIKGKRGVAYLAMKANVSILPVKINGPLNLTPKMFLSRKAKFKVCIGKPFKLNDFFSSFDDETLAKAAEFVMEKIRNSC